MKEKLLLAGAGGFGRVVLEHVQDRYQCAFLDDGAADQVDGAPVLGALGDLERFWPEYRLLLVTIGNNALRQRIYERAAEIGYTFPNVILPSAYVSPRAKLGTGCVILNNAVVQHSAVLGSGVILNPGVEAHHACTIGDNVLIYTNSVVRSLAKVGDRVWIGSTATVSTGAQVPPDTVIPDGGVFSSQ